MDGYFMRPAPASTGLTAWGETRAREIALPGAPNPLELRMVLDAQGYWMEVGFCSDKPLLGDASRGWIDPVSELCLRLQITDDLQQMNATGFVDCAGSPTENEDGNLEYWSRSVVPAYWLETMVDYTLTTNRYGKSITAMTVAEVPLDLDFPYAMPADQAALQADLRSAGFTDATVTHTDAALSVEIKNHTSAWNVILGVTMSGANVTAVTYLGSPVSCGCPYSMPSQRAALQSALRTAGVGGAVVMLYGDAWTVFLPDVPAAGQTRDFSATISPDDPHPNWGGFGNAYQGEISNSGLEGTSGNVRTPEGAPLLEAAKQFARLCISRS